jgi:hypothetical protein
MPSVARQVLAVVLGLIVGSAVNLAVLSAGMRVIPMPEGADTKTPEGLKAAMARMTTMNFVPPLAAHALGTVAGALFTAWMAPTRKMPLAFVIGGFFLLGGVGMVAMIGGPLWFIVADLGFAYLPMAWLGGKLGAKWSAG